VKIRFPALVYGFVIKKIIEFLLPGMEAQINRKSQEIAFALMRMASSIRRFELRKKFEALAIHLLENCYYRNFDLAIDSLRVIYGFLEFGKNIYEIEPMNARILGREVYDMRLVLEKLNNKTDESLEDVFASQLSADDLPVPNFEDNKEMRKNKEKKAISSFPNKAVPAKAADPNERQNMIVASLKERGRLQLKDIRDILPDVTARTIRYDLKDLVDRGFINRDGKGPASFYSLDRVVGMEIKGEEGENTATSGPVEILDVEADFGGPDTVINP